ncbi:probable methyltransferase PMT2 [Tanacetum coccineum]
MTRNGVNYWLQGDIRNKQDLEKLFSQAYQWDACIDKEAHAVMRGMAKKEFPLKIINPMVNIPGQDMNGGLFTNDNIREATKAKIQSIIIEVHGVILRCISRDEAALVVAQKKVKNIAESMRWDTKLVDHEDGPMDPEKILIADVTLGNILLDAHMKPRISDFGIAKSFQDNETEANSDCFEFEQEVAATVESMEKAARYTSNIFAAM